MKFYVFENPDDTEKEGVTDFLPGDPLNTGRLPNAPKCEVCGKFMGNLSWLPPYKAELEFWGKEAGDVAFRTAEGFLVSEKFKELYKKSNLIGLSGFIKVEIVKVKRHKRNYPKTIPIYYYVRVPITPAKLDFKTSGVVYEYDEICIGCNSGKNCIKQSIEKVVLEQGSWSGEDIFIARGLWGSFLTTQRFKDFYIDNNLKNGDFINADKFHKKW